jgi:hypothetical protein
MYLANVYNIMIASPGDVTDERKAAREIILDWNNLHSAKRSIVLLPLLWEYNSSPSLDDRAQAVINKQVLKNADLLIGIFWTRIGTPTGKAASGTVEEIEEHIREGKPAMLYFSSKQVSLDNVNLEQYEAVKKLKKEYQGRGLTDTFDTLQDFKDKFQRHLQMKANDNSIFVDLQQEEGGSYFEEQEIKQEDLSEEAKLLLKEASKDRNGQIMKLGFLGGSFTIQTHGKRLNSGDGARERAKWNSALDELLREDLIIEKGFKGEIYELTKKGFELADKID